MSAPHVCSDCGRTYRALETLNRHRKNHSGNFENVCDTCGATFKRKDILDRHAKIHDDTTATSVRRRAPRACDRCSSLKSKCNGRTPCSRCATAGQTCVFNGARGRSLTANVVPGPPTAGTWATVRESTDNRCASPARASGLLAPGVESVAHPRYPETSWVRPEQMEWPPDIDMDTGWLQDQDLPSFLWSENIMPGPSQPAGSTLPVVQPIGLPNNNMLWNYNIVPASPGAIWSTLDPLDHLQGKGDIGPNAPPVRLSSLQTEPVAMQSSADCDAQLMTHSAERSTRDILEYNDMSVHLRSTKDEVIESLSAWCMQCCLGARSDTRARQETLKAYARKIETIFGIERSTAGHTDVLEYFVALFIRRFYPSWPLLSQQGVERPHTLPAHLYLTMSAIGAGFAGERAADFHRAMMRSLRIHLTRATFEHEFRGHALLSLCQSLAYIQATILYFGHTSAFTFLQQLGMLSCAIGRKLDLFNESGLQRITSFGSSSASIRADTEMRRQLAFGLLKLEAFNSLLHDSRPGVSFPEFNLYMPAASTPKIPFSNPDGDLCLQRTERYLFCDLVNIGLDREEAYPDLRLDELETVLYGLQTQVWRFSYARMSGGPTLDLALAALDIDTTNGVGPAATSERVGSLFSGRQMNDTRTDHFRVVTALTKWLGALRRTAQNAGGSNQRTLLLASRLLYNISLMKMAAHLADMHHVALCRVEGTSPRYHALASLYRWADAKIARVAVQRACSTWSLVAAELTQTESERASFDILTQVALLNAAVVIWTYAGTQMTANADTFTDDDTQARSMDCGRLPLCRNNNAPLMESFADLLKAVTPAWTPGSSTQYALTVQALVEAPLPLLLACE